MQLCVECAKVEDGPVQLWLTSPTLIVFTVLFVFFVAVFMFIACSGSTTKTARKKKLVKLQKFGEGSRGAFSSEMFKMLKSSKVRFKTFASFGQITVNVGFNTGIVFPNLYEAFLRPFAVFNLQFLPALGLQCKFSRLDFVDKVVVLTIVPLLVCAALGVLYAFQVLRKKWVLNHLRAHVNKYAVNRDIEKLLNDPDACQLYSFQDVCQSFAFLDSKGKGVITKEKLIDCASWLYIDDPEETVDQLMRESQHLRESMKSSDGFKECGEEEEEVESSDVLTFEDFARAGMHQEETAAGIFIGRCKSRIEKPAGRKIIYCFLLFTFLVLVGASAILFEYFQCREFELPEDEDGGFESYIRRDLSVDCLSARYKAYLWFAIAMLFVYPIGIPALYVALLSSQRHVLQSPEAMKEEASMNFPTVGHVLFLTEAYKPE